MNRDLLPGGKFDWFVAERAGRDEFSGTVLVAHRGEPVLVRSYGMADRKRSIPNRADTRFNLASLTKPFTGLAVVQLAQQGKFAFHETLGTHLDGFPEHVANTVTIHQLLSHTSGMGDYSDTKEFQHGVSTWDTAAEVMAGFMGIIRDSELLFTPGTRYGYSNSGYVVLGALAARLSGASYYDCVQRNVFAHAGMVRSAFLTGPQVLASDDVAHPYKTSPTGEHTDTTEGRGFGFIGGPANGAYSTVTDLLHFAGVLLDAGVLDDAYTRLAISGKTALRPDDPPAVPGLRYYGYGFRVTILGNQRIIGHSGSGIGNRTNLDIYPDLDWVTVVLGNYDTTVDPIVQLSRDLITGHR